MLLEFLIVLVVLGAEQEGLLGFLVDLDRELGLLGVGLFALCDLLLVLEALRAKGALVLDRVALHAFTADELIQFVNDVLDGFGLSEALLCELID